MPVSGNIKSKKLSLQNDAGGVNYSMSVSAADEFELKRGNDILLSVAPDDEQVLSGVSDAVTKLTIVKDTIFEGNVIAKNGITNGGISDELKTLIKTEMRADKFFQEGDIIQDSNNVDFVKFSETKKMMQCSVSIQKNGDTFSHFEGIGQVGKNTEKPSDDLYHYTFSVGKTMPSVVFAKMLTDGLIKDRNMKLSDIFPQMKNITFKVVREASDGETPVGTAKKGKAAWGGWPLFDEKDYDYVVVDPKREAVLTDLFTDSFPLQECGDGHFWSFLDGTGLMKHNVPYCDFNGDSPVVAAANGELSLRAEEIFGNFMSNVADPLNTQGSQTLYYYKEPGQTTYTSSEYFEAAVLEKIYNDHHNLVGEKRLELIEIFRKEIGEKINCDLFYYLNDSSDQRLNQVSNIIALHQDSEGNNDGFMHDASADGKEGREWYKLGLTNNVRARFNVSFAYLHGRCSDWISLCRLLSNKGVYTKADGKKERLINSTDLAYMMRPHREFGEREKDNGYYAAQKGKYGFLGHPTGISEQDQYVFDAGTIMRPDGQSGETFPLPFLYTHFKGWRAFGTGGITLLFSVEHDACIFISAQQRIYSKEYEHLVANILNGFINEL